MDRLLEILEEIIPGEDVENCTTLVDDNILDSFAIISLVAALEDEYDIVVSPADLVPENFNSAQALAALVAEYLPDAVLTHPFTRAFVGAWRAGGAEGPDAITALRNDLSPEMCVDRFMLPCRHP